MNRVPMAFLYGGKDAAGKRYSGECLKPSSEATGG